MREDALLARLDVRDRRPRHRRLKPTPELLLCQTEGTSTLKQALAEVQVKLLERYSHRT